MLTVSILGQCPWVRVPQSAQWQQGLLSTLRECPLSFPLIISVGSVPASRSFLTQMFYPTEHLRRALCRCPGLSFWTSISFLVLRPANSNSLGVLRLSAPSLLIYTVCRFQLVLLPANNG